MLREQKAKACIVRACWRQQAPRRHSGRWPAPAPTSLVPSATQGRERASLPSTALGRSLMSAIFSPSYANIAHRLHADYGEDAMVIM